MANKGTEAGEGNGTETEPTMVEPLEEEAVVVVEAAVEEAVVEEDTTTTKMVEEAVVTTMEAEVAEATTMDIRITLIRGTNNKRSHISNNNKCLQQFHCPIPQEVLSRSFKATTWTTMQIKPVITLTVAFGATNEHTGRDQPALVQRASSR